MRADEAMRAYHEGLITTAELWKMIGFAFVTPPPLDDLDALDAWVSA